MTNQINNERYLVKLHQDILKIMDEVERICTKFHLCYYLMGGSCLGAIRHNGFIPWDDDLDIVMPRADFDRFIALLSDDNNKCEKDRVLGDGFFLRWISTEKSYNLPYAKVCLKGTKFQEINGLAAKSAGIFVDVFPLDSCGPYGKIIKLKSYFLSALNNCLFYKGVTRVTCITTWD
jgi:lipopolysaccharide cholinephosphotransferase